MMATVSDDPVTVLAGVKCSVTHCKAPVRFNIPRSISIRATQNSIDSPSRGGITTPKIMIADPTRKIVTVCPSPHNRPMMAELLIDCWRLTMVDTATT